MIKLTNKPAKVKPPRIEIIECKVKTKSEKKLDLEMFQQAKEARILLDRLLYAENEFDAQRKRANSLTNILISEPQTRFIKMKPRGSVPNIGKLKEKILRKSTPKSSPGTSPSVSPSTSRSRIIALNYTRKYTVSEALADVTTMNTRGEAT